MKRSSTTMALRRYAPLGRCMYCLARGLALSEEHLIPRCLGGRLTLRDAVCEPCRAATGRPEQATLEREFLVAKTLLALKRRRARAQGPARLPVVAIDGAADAMARELGAAQFPRGFALPAFEPAGLLAGVDRPHGPAQLEFIDCTLQVGAPARIATAARPALADPHAYAFSIAKWAYGLAVAERGLDACASGAIRALLVGARADPFNFVGTPRPREAATATQLHSVAVRDDGRWLRVHLGLLGSAGMLPYEVVIGAVATA